MVHLEIKPVLIDKKGLPLSTCPLSFPDLVVSSALVQNPAVEVDLTKDPHLLCGKVLDKGMMVSKSYLSFSANRNSEIENRGRNVQSTIKKQWLKV